MGTLLGVSVPLPCQKVPTDVMGESVHIAPSMGGEEPFSQGACWPSGLGQVKEVVDHGSPAHTGESTGTSVGLHLWKPMLHPGAMVGQWNLAKGDLRFKPEEEKSEEVGDSSLKRHPCSMCESLIPEIWKKQVRENRLSSSLGTALGDNTSNLEVLDEVIFRSTRQREPIFLSLRAAALAGLASSTSNAGPQLPPLLLLPDRTERPGARVALAFRTSPEESRGSDRASSPRLTAAASPSRRQKEPDRLQAFLVGAEKPREPWQWRGADSSLGGQALAPSSSVSTEKRAGRSARSVKTALIRTQNPSSFVDSLIHLPAPPSAARFLRGTPGNPKSRQKSPRFRAAAAAATTRRASG